MKKLAGVLVVGLLVGCAGIPVASALTDSGQADCNIEPGTVTTVPFNVTFSAPPSVSISTTEPTCDLVGPFSVTTTQFRVICSSEVACPVDWSASGS